jgi:hypothetical protein
MVSDFMSPAFLKPSYLLDCLEISMVFRCIRFLPVFVICVSFIVGCGSKEPTVIQPAAEYNPTEQQLKNDQALQKAAEAPPETVDPRKPDFSGN